MCILLVYAKSIIVWASVRVKVVGDGQLSRNILRLSHHPHWTPESLCDDSLPAVPRGPAEGPAIQQPQESDARCSHAPWLLPPDYWGSNCLSWWYLFIEWLYCPFRQRVHQNSIHLLRAVCRYQLLELHELQVLPALHCELCMLPISFPLLDGWCGSTHREQRLCVSNAHLGMLWSPFTICSWTFPDTFENTHFDCRRRCSSNDFLQRTSLPLSWSPISILYVLLRGGDALGREQNSILLFGPPWTRLSTVYEAEEYNSVVALWIERLCDWQHEIVYFCSCLLCVLALRCPTLLVPESRPCCPSINPIEVAAVVVIEVEVEVDRWIRCPLRESLAVLEICL